MARVSRSELLWQGSYVVAGAALAAASVSAAVLGLWPGSVLTGMVAASFVSALAVSVPLVTRLATLEGQARNHRRAATRAATYDPATLFLNRGAFGGMVERRVETASRNGRRQGAFVIVDAGEVRGISRRHGLDWGDEALRLIAGAIRANIRSDDIVGRIGSDQFGVFLAGATEADAADICGRVDAAVKAVHFAPGEDKSVLSVTFGGIVFDNELGFDDMFRRAAAQLDAGAGTSPARLNVGMADRPVH